MGLFPDTPPPGLISLKSTFPVKETVDKLIHLVESKGLTVFCRVDHAAYPRPVRAVRHGDRPPPNGPGPTTDERAGPGTDTATLTGTCHVPEVQR